MRTICRSLGVQAVVRRVEDEDEPEVTVYFNLSKATGMPWFPADDSEPISVDDAAFAASMLKGAREKWGAQFTGRQDAEAEGRLSIRLPFSRL